MPLFTAEEYKSRRARPHFEDAYPRLPVLARWDGLRVRWIGPLIELGFERWADELYEAAYGVLADECGWAGNFEDCGPMRGSGGGLRCRWTKAFGAAARELAIAGGQAGFEGNPERVASWLAFNLADTHDLLRERAKRRGALE